MLMVRNPHYRAPSHPPQTTPTDMQVVKNSHYRARKLGLWNRLIPDLVSSSGNIRDPIAPETFPGATLPTITLVPTVRATNRP